MASIGSTTPSSNRVKVKSNLGGRLVDILIDTGAACSCTDIPLPLTNKTIQIKGIGDTVMTATLTKPVRLDLGSVVLTEPFWYLPDNSEGTVLGMDIMGKHGFTIHCLEKQIKITKEKMAKNKQDINCVSILSISSPDPVEQLITKHSDTLTNHEHDCDLTGFEQSIGENAPPQVLTEDLHKRVTELPSSHTLNSFQKVLGISNYLHEFIPDFADTVTPLCELPKGKSQSSDFTTWTDGHEKTFTKLREGLRAVPVLNLPNPPKHQKDGTDGFHWSTSRCQEGGPKWVDATYTRKNCDTRLSEPNDSSVWTTCSNSVRPRQPFHRLSAAIQRNLDPT